MIPDSVIWLVTSLTVDSFREIYSRTHQILLSDWSHRWLSTHSAKNTHVHANVTPFQLGLVTLLACYWRTCYKIIASGRIDGLKTKSTGSPSPFFSPRPTSAFFARQVSFSTRSTWDPVGRFILEEQQQQQQQQQNFYSHILKIQYNCPTFEYSNSVLEEHFESLTQHQSKYLKDCVRHTVNRTKEVNCISVAGHHQFLILQILW